MTLTRRHVLAGLSSAPLVFSLARPASAAPALKISHQFPGGTIEQGDFRDRLCRKFAEEVKRRAGVPVEFEVYPNSSLMKTNAQFSAMRKGALDLSLFPLAYAGGELHICNLGLMPCLVTSYEQGAKWRTSKVGQAMTKALEDKGIMFVSWLWQAGGVASRSRPVLVPDDAKGLKIRGGSREMDLMFAAAGAQVSTMPSNEIYIGMQTGSLDAAVTSSTSLVSFRLDELSKSVTAPRGHSFWFMLEPLLMSKAVFDGLPLRLQKAIVEVGLEMEAFGEAESRKDDQILEQVYSAKGAKVAVLTNAVIAKWRAVAEASAWKDYAGKSPEAADLLKLALQVA